MSSDPFQPSTHSLHDYTANSMCDEREGTLILSMISYDSKCFSQETEIETLLRLSRRLSRSSSPKVSVLLVGRPESRECRIVAVSTRYPKVIMRASRQSAGNESIGQNLLFITSSHVDMDPPAKP
jgi:hypothetical protein